MHTETVDQAARERGTTDAMRYRGFAAIVLAHTVIDATLEEIESAKRACVGNAQPRSVFWEPCASRII